MSYNTYIHTARINLAGATDLQFAFVYVLLSTVPWLEVRTEWSRVLRDVTQAKDVFAQWCLM